MKVCKYCGIEVDNSKRKCPSCGSVDFLHVCENCSEHFIGMYCPRCGVKVGQKGKKCPVCKTIYFSNACPNCGYSILHKTTSKSNLQSVSTPPPARPKVTSKTASETIGRTFTAPSGASNKLPKKSKKWLWIFILLFLLAAFSNNPEKKSKTKAPSDSSVAPASSVTRIQSMEESTESQNVVESIDPLNDKKNKETE